MRLVLIPTRLVTALAMSSALTVLAAGCGGSGSAGRDTGRLRVVAGFFPLAEMARRVGGDLVDVHDLTPAGVEPHDVELRSRDVDLVEDADLVLYLSGFQPALEEVALRSDGTAIDLLAVIPRDRRADAHFWLDPTLLQRAVYVVETALVERSPEDFEPIAARSRAYRAELAALDRELADGLSDCDRTTLVTAHAAFGHFAARYGLREEAIAGVSPEAEPDARRLDRLAGLVRRERVTTVFTEALASPDAAVTLARETGTATAVLDPIEGLRAGDARAGTTYAALMRRNLVALTTALGCR